MRRPRHQCQEDVLDEIREIKELCAEYNINLRFFTNPMHAMTYAKDMRTYNNAGVQTVTIESLHNSMTEPEYETVQYCVRQKLMVEKFQAYLDIAPLQDIDPTNEHVLKSTYVVNGADAMTTTGLVDLYNGYFLSDDFISGLAAMITDEKEHKYASSLIIPGAVASTATSEKETTVGSNVFAVTIIL